MIYLDMIGFLAAGFTIAAFYSTGMLCLRILAIAANLLFMVYGWGSNLVPVLLLHCLLLPLNVLRLADGLARRRRAVMATLRPDGASTR